MNNPSVSRIEITDMAIAILQATSDGDKLAPADLKLVELAVNDMLNPKGIVVFHQLYENVTKPHGYTAPYLFGIEHLTIDHHRYIRWKGVVVEHFDHGFWQQAGGEERMHMDAEKVAARCRRLEAEGIQPTGETVRGWSRQ
jgi:hypothetical protein